MPPKITVVGSFAVGLTMNVPRLPVRGETLLGSGFAIGPGGKGSNQAVGAARLGALSRFVAMIGVDNFGDIAVEMYRREGVDITHLKRTSERPTGVGFIIVGPSGEAVCLGAEEEGLLVGEIRKERLCMERESIPAFRSRRPELYAVEL